MDILLPKKDRHKTSTIVSTTPETPHDSTPPACTPRMTPRKGTFSLQKRPPNRPWINSPLYIGTKNVFHFGRTFALSTLSNYPPPSSCSIFTPEKASYPPPTGG